MTEISGNFSFLAQADWFLDHLKIPYKFLIAFCFPSNLKQHVAISESSALGLATESRQMADTLENLELALKAKDEEGRELDCQQKGVIENKNREISVLAKNLKSAKDLVEALNSTVTNMGNEKKRLEKAGNKKDEENKSLHLNVANLEKKLEFKSSLEKSFESLQVMMLVLSYFDHDHPQHH